MANVAPPMILSCSVRTLNIEGYWSGTPGVDDAAGQPNQWRLLMDVNTQLHSSYGSLRPQQYDVRDIEVGDYIITESSARIYRIIQIINQNTINNVELIVEDEDKLNALMDTSQGGDGSILDGVGFIFKTKNQLPVLFPLPDVLPANFSIGFAAEILSRFFQRGKHDTLQVYQPGHSFTIGTAVVLNSNGLYSAVDYTTQSAGLAKYVIGVVEETQYPTTDHFRIRTAGPVLDMALTNGGPGQLYFIDYNSSTGGMIDVDPNTLSSRRSNQPVYIKIDNRRAVFVNSGLDNTENLASTFVVNDLSELNSLTTAKLGDVAYVKNVASANDWGYYTYTTDGWTVVISKSGIAAQARSIKRTVDINSLANTPLFVVKSGIRIVNVSVRVITPFNDANAALSVGDTAVSNRFMNIGENDLTDFGSYYSFPNHIYDTGGADATITATLSHTASVGQAEILITYV